MSDLGVSFENKDPQTTNIQPSTVRMDEKPSVPEFMLKYTNYNASQWAITKTQTKDDKISPEDLLDVASQSIQ